MTTPFQMTFGQLTEPVTGDDHIRGPATAPVTLVEYGDYQCPYCGAAHPIVKELLRQRPTEVRMVYRHFPLTTVHPYAELAAEVAEAAGARQQFWQMHDWLFTHQEELSPVTLRLGIEQLGLPVEEIDQEVRFTGGGRVAGHGDHPYLDRIRRDFIGGVRSGVNGTPTFFINGIRHDQGYTLPELLLAVDEAANTR